MKKSLFYILFLLAGLNVYGQYTIEEELWHYTDLNGEYEYLDTIRKVIDENNNLLIEYSTNMGSSYELYSHTYNSQNQRTSTIRYSADFYNQGKYLLDSTSYEYQKENNLIIESHFSIVPEANYEPFFTKSQMDEFGNITSKVNYYVKGDTMSYSLMQYNSLNLLTEEKVFARGTKFKSHFQFTYDQKNQLNSWIHFNENLDTLIQNTYKNQYDLKNNLIAQERIFDGRVVQSELFIYNEDNSIKEILIESPNNFKLKKSFSKLSEKTRPNWKTFVIDKYVVEEELISLSYENDLKKVKLPHFIQTRVDPSRGKSKITICYDYSGKEINAYSSGFNPVFTCKTFELDTIVSPRFYTYRQLYNLLKLDRYQSGLFCHYEKKGTNLFKVKKSLNGKVFNEYFINIRYDDLLESNISYSDLENGTLEKVLVEFYKIERLDSK